MASRLDHKNFAPERLLHPNAFVGQLPVGRPVGSELKQGVMLRAHVGVLRSNARNALRLRMLGRGLSQSGDPFGDRQGPARHLGVQEFDHFAVELDHSLALVLRQRESVDDGACALDLGRGRREDLVADIDLTRVDQRLAVEADVPPLQAFGAKTVEILDVVVDAVDDVAPREPGRRRGCWRERPSWWAGQG